MKTIQRVVIACWIILGVGLIVDGIADLPGWAEFGGYTNPSWWLSTNILRGVLSLFLAICMIQYPKAAAYLGYTMSFVIIFYVVYIFAITPPEHRISPMLALQCFVLLLCAATIMVLFKRRGVMALKEQNSN